tara:strand:- start:20 stop:625 length:606 start_codon:yes stop_codon:yes gene_type:complete
MARMGDRASYRRTGFRRASTNGGLRAVRPPAAEPSWRESARGIAVLLVAAPLALFTAILFVDGPPHLFASPQAEPSAKASGAAVAGTRFGPCLGGKRYTCVVDGDTIWLEGTKIRIADIDAPEISKPGCEAERLAGERATARLTQWLNAGAFEVHASPDGRDTDRYGRKLRVLSRGGASALDALMAEGVATRWGGAGARWC